jgi:hypothetical protein
MPTAVPTVKLREATAHFNDELGMLSSCPRRPVLACSSGHLLSLHTPNLLAALPQPRLHHLGGRSRSARMMPPTAGHGCVTGHGTQPRTTTEGPCRRPPGLPTPWGSLRVSGTGPPAGTVSRFHSSSTRCQNGGPGWARSRTDGQAPPHLEHARHRNGVPNRVTIRCSSRCSHSEYRTRRDVHTFG